MRFFLAFLALAPALFARPFTVVAYNVENLFDVDGIAVYEEYQSAAYTPAHLRTKLDHIAQVVARIGDNGRGPDIILFEEIEVDRTPESRVDDQAAFLRRYAGTTFEKMLTAPLTPEERDVAAVEGRILGAVERHIRRTKQDTLELLRILRDGVPERKSRSGSMALPRSLKHGLKAR